MGFLTRALVTGALAIAVGACHSETEFTVGTLVIADAVVPAPTTPETGALYLTIRNLGDVADTLWTIQSPIAPTGEIHQSMDAGAGMRRMAPLPFLAIAARATVRFAPGGLHGMWLDLHRQPRPGDTVPVTLRFSSGTVTVIAPVVAYADLSR